MSIESELARHWTDDELIAGSYGVGPEDGHLEVCARCRGLLAQMNTRRKMVNEAGREEVSFEFLAAQRRSVYARMAEPVRWWSRYHMRRWASAAATVAVLGAALFYYENARQQNMAAGQLSDAQLAQDVSTMAANSEPSPTAPLQSLFEP